MLPVLRIIVSIWIVAFHAMAQGNITYIDQVPGYASLPTCAESQLSIIVRDMSSGCGASSSYGCFCSTRYATMNTIIATAVYSDCHDGADANSAVAVFADYCSSTPMITLAVDAPAPAVVTTTASLLVALSSATPSRTPSTFTTSIRPDTSFLQSTFTTMSPSSTLGDQSPTATISIPSNTKTNIQGSSSIGVSTGATVGISVGIGALLMIGGTALWWCLRSRRARRNDVPRRSSMSQSSTQGDDRYELEGSAETSPLLKKARRYRDTDPKTPQSIDGEKDSLVELIQACSNLPEQTQEKLVEKFNYTRALVETMLDLLALTPAGQTFEPAVAKGLCSQLLDISTRIYNERPGARCLALFYEGQVLLTQARLLELTESSSLEIKHLYEVAFREFSSAKQLQLSDNPQVFPDSEVQRYHMRSMLACAFIVVKRPECIYSERVLIADKQYVHAKTTLSNAIQRGKVSVPEVMLRLDEELVQSLTA
ncbi:uncharacterized protein PAC_02744 [Phialocephala subalpina]|uniref:Extracellular membrane protein CFEM domain-containing protein n=1 Tax=Phialocephala subalpina TaxID=576137 RepID=A0A1L7WJB1_9HELO|nr:uncharacterized protein PAC_02744 [Phialocephala subalpina]